MINNNLKIGFIGAGNMATALIKGLVQSGTYKKNQLFASDMNKQALKNISDGFGIKCYPVNTELVREVSVVVLSVKPSNMREVLEDVKADIREDHLIISIAAGIPIKMIENIIEKDIPFIRAMPNTPALVLKGVSALSAGKYADPGHMEIAVKIFGAVGETVVVEETLMDAVTALSGSGPGYIFRIMECMVDAGVSSGLEKEMSRILIIQTFLGSANLAKDSDLSVSGLREMVTSPGGTTEAGLAVLERMGLKEMISKTVEAACKRSVELGRIQS
ncbi:MAG: pyrroline-5-carboxylate reductase [Deltaproteobacteria bacterium]|nr:pyrroline-5-carboxylate reductase [Deltaproteobacteria bacterium]